MRGDLWLKAIDMYTPLIKDSRGKFRGKARIREDSMTITFPSGARLQFSSLSHENELSKHYGKEYSRIWIDEFQFFTQRMYDVLRTRLRSNADVPSAIRLTCNPDPNHFMLDYIRIFLDEDGFPIKEDSGRTAYYFIHDGVVHTSFSREELEEKFPEDKEYIMDYTFISGSIYDNPAVIASNPQYISQLKSQPPDVQRALLYGNWFTGAGEKQNFDRTWCEQVYKLPNDLRIVRGWDKAGVAPSPSNRNPDYTAGVLMGKDREGNYYIMNAVRFRMNVGERNQEMIKIAMADGEDTSVILPEDSAAAGKFEFQESCKMFIENGFTPKKDISKGNKLLRFQPFSAAAQAGCVKIFVPGFDPNDLKLYLLELENFVGVEGRQINSSGKRKDDWVDATATAFNYLCKQKVIPTFTLQRPNSPTMMSHVKGL